MDRIEALEIQLTERFQPFKRILRRVYGFLTFRVGGVSILSLLIIIGAVTVNFYYLQSKLFEQLHIKPQLKNRIAPLVLKGNMVFSLIPEAPEVFQGGSFGDKLIDGSLGSIAAPGNANIDYVLDLGSLTEVHEITIYWGTFGTDREYLQQWKIEGRENTSNETPWMTLDKGGFPFSNKTVIKVDKKRLAQLRLSASGGHQIGVQEIIVVGKFLE